MRGLYGGNIERDLLQNPQTIDWQIDRRCGFVDFGGEPQADYVKLASMPGEADKLCALTCHHVVAGNSPGRCDFLSSKTALNRIEIDTSAKLPSDSSTFVQSPSEEDRHDTLEGAKGWRDNADKKFLKYLETNRQNIEMGTQTEADARNLDILRQLFELASNRAKQIRATGSNVWSSFRYLRDPRCPFRVFARLGFDQYYPATYQYGESVSDQYFFKKKKKQF